MLERQIKKVPKGEIVLALQPISNNIFNSGSHLEKQVKKAGRWIINELPKKIASSNKTQRKISYFTLPIALGLKNLYGLSEIISRTFETSLRGSGKQAKKYIDNTTTKQKISHLALMGSLIAGYKTIQDKSKYSPEIENKNIVLTQQGKEIMESNKKRKEIKKTIQERDSLLKILKDDVSYIDLKNQFVEKSILNASKEAFEEINLETLMRATNQKGLYELFSFYNLNKDKPNQIDFEAAIDSMWSFKKNKLPKKYQDFADSLANSYDQKKAVKSSLKEYRKMVSNNLEEMLQEFNIDKFTKGRNKEHKEFVENIVENLDEDIFLAYSTTELFPNLNPTFNLSIYDKFLKEAGLDYLMRVPALYDKLLSFGPGQLTNFAISKDKSACSLNKYLSEDLKIPDSMDKMNTIEEHIRGSIANMIYNSHYIASKMSKKDLENFNDIYSQMDSKSQKLLITQLISGAHHRPKDVAKKLSYFVEQSSKNKVNKKDILNGIQYNKAVKKYCDQSMITYLALQNWE